MLWANKRYTDSAGCDRWQSFCITVLVSAAVHWACRDCNPYFECNRGLLRIFLLFIFCHLKLAFIIMDQRFVCSTAPMAQSELFDFNKWVRVSSIISFQNVIRLYLDQAFLHLELKKSSKTLLEDSLLVISFLRDHLVIFTWHICLFRTNKPVDFFIFFITHASG